MPRKVRSPVAYLLKCYNNTLKEGCCGIHDDFARALGEERAVEGEVFGLEGAGVGHLGHAAQGLRLAGERAVVDLQHRSRVRLACARAGGTRLRDLQIDGF